MSKLLRMLLLILLSLGTSTCGHKALRKLPIPDVETATFLSDLDGAVVGHLLSADEKMISKDDYLKSWALKPGGFLFSGESYSLLKAWIEKVCREVKCDPKLVKALAKFDRRYRTNYPEE